MMGWGSKVIEIRSVETSQLDGVFMHKKTQKLKFLCERNDKVTNETALIFATCMKQFVIHKCCRFRHVDLCS